MKKLLAILLAVVFVMGLAACGNTSQPGQPSQPSQTGQPSQPNNNPSDGDEPAPIGRQTVKIAVNTCFTGPAARGAELQYNGFMVGLNEIIESGYSKYYDFEILVNDDENDASAAASVANKAVYQQGAHIIYGHLNAVQTLAGLALYDEAGIPCLTPTTSSSVTAFGSDYLLQMGVADDTTCRWILDYLVLELGYKNLAVMYSGNEQGYAALDALNAKLDEFNMDFACEEEYSTTDIDFSGQLLRIREKKCDAVILWGGDPAGRVNIVTQIKQLFDYDITIVGDTQFSTASFLNSVDPELKEGIICAVAWTPTLTDERSQKFCEDFKAIDSYGALPSDVSSRGYDSMYLIATALNELGPYDVEADDFREKLLEKLKEVSIVGLQGPISYTENGACISNSYVVSIGADGSLNVVYGG